MKPPRLASPVRYMPAGRLAVFNSVCSDGRWLLRMRDTGRYVVTVPERCVILIEKKARTMKALREYAEQLKATEMHYTARREFGSFEIRAFIRAWAKCGMAELPDVTGDPDGERCSGQMTGERPDTAGGRICISFATDAALSFRSSRTVNNQIEELRKLIAEHDALRAKLEVLNSLPPVGTGDRISWQHWNTGKDIIENELLIEIVKTGLAELRFRSSKRMEELESMLGAVPAGPDAGELDLIKGSKDTEPAPSNPKRDWSGPRSVADMAESHGYRAEDC